MRRKKLWLIMIIIIMWLNCIPVSAVSSVPYHTYNYDYWEYIYYTPAAYIPRENISGVNTGSGMLNNPQDIFVAEDGKIYVADTGNNRIVVFDSSMKLERIVDSFENEGKKDTFSSPHGVFVTSDNKLYIADTDNLRVVVLDENGSLNRIISNPTSEVLAQDFVFSPLKVVADYAERAYVIAKNMFQGIMAFDENGNLPDLQVPLMLPSVLMKKYGEGCLPKGREKNKFSLSQQNLPALILMMRDLYMLLILIPMGNSR